jgi:hypothetical protein
MKLEKDVTEMLVEIVEARFLPYVQTDGTMIVWNEELMYGYQEAAHYWNNEISEVFLENRYKRCMKDKCVFVKQEAGKHAICGSTVDDNFFAATKDKVWINEQVEMLRVAFKEVTVIRANEIGIVGMHLNGS